MDYASQQTNTYAAAACASAAAYHPDVEPTVEGPLQRIIRRIEGDADGLNGLARRLREHADAVHGAVPETGSEPYPTPVRSGLVGSIEDALDNLDRALMFAGEQTERNCTLA